MAEPKAKTIQERFGFLDSDLKTPKHDEIMLWLDENIERIIGRFIKTGNWDMDQIKESQKSVTVVVEKRKAELEVEIARLEQTFEMSGGRSSGIIPWRIIDTVNLHEFKSLHSKLSSFRELPEPSPWEWRIIGKTWELPVANEGYKTKYIVGFIDMSVQVSIPSDLRVNVHKDSLGHLKSVEWDEGRRTETFFFEVKSTIPSLGELVRQINMYKEYCQGRFVVVSPDDRFAAHLKRMDIEFVKYEP